MSDLSTSPGIRLDNTSAVVVKWIEDYATIDHPQELPPADVCLDCVRVAFYDTDILDMEIDHPPYGGEPGAYTCVICGVHLENYKRRMTHSEAMALVPNHSPCSGALAPLRRGFWDDVQWWVYACEGCGMEIDTVEGGVHQWNKEKLMVDGLVMIDAIEKGGAKTCPKAPDGKCPVCRQDLFESYGAGTGYGLGSFAFCENDECENQWTVYNFKEDSGE